MPEVIPHHTLTSLVSQHDQALALAVEGVNKLIEAKKIIHAALGPYHDTILPRGELRDSALEYRSKELPGAMAAQVTEQFWRYTLQQARIREKLSRADRDKTDAMFKDHTVPEYTLDTLLATLRGLIEDQPEIAKAAAEETFELLRAKRGYATNNEFAVGEKVILTGIVESKFGWRISHYHDDDLADLDKTFHLLDGKGFPKWPGDMITAMQTAMRDGHQEAETEFFALKWFKKGTLHITFKRMDLVQELNRIGSKGRGALGREEKRKGRAA